MTDHNDNLRKDNDRLRAWLNELTRTELIGRSRRPVYGERERRIAAKALLGEAAPTD